MKMAKFISKIAYLAAFGLALEFTLSCSSSKDNSVEGVSFNDNSQIYNADGTIYKGSGVIKARTYNEHENKILINAGNVVDGIVQLELPTITDEYLFREYLNDEDQKFCTSYTKGIKVFDGDFVLTSGNEDESYLVIAYRGDQLKEEIRYYYFPKAVKIICNFPENTGFINIEAKVGWNRIYYRKTNHTKEHSTKNILAEQVTWIISEK